MTANMLSVAVNVGWPTANNGNLSFHDLANFILNVNASPKEHP